MTDAPRKKSIRPKVSGKKLATGGNAGPKGDKDKDEPTMIVGVGSSAGGLQPLKELIGSLDADAKLCVVIAQHVTPTHESLLAELLAPRTKLKVKYLNRAMTPTANTVLVVPPNSDMTVENGRFKPLRVDGARVRGPRPSIDHLFSSLASEFGDRAVAVVLSGTGADGTNGTEAIRAAGGIVLVPEPGSAQFDAMPRSVIESRQYDLILSPADMGDALLRIAREANDPVEAKSLIKAVPESLVKQIKVLVRKRTGLNLDHYKMTTVLRRIRRRMQLAGCSDMQQYLAFMTGDADEATRLAGDLSVRVTSFFRDPEHFQKLKAVIEEKVERLEVGEMLRIWVPGCASGEEAYSIGILLMEAFRQQNRQASFLMFVSDINPDSVAMARAGLYSEERLKLVPEPLRQRYFDITDGVAEVSKAIRQFMIFATQNTVEDPPFSKLDLLSCRNLLIYFEAPTQKHVIAAFHYALKPDGVLFLGASETIEIQKDLFEILDSNARLYGRKSHPVVYQFSHSRKVQDEALAESNADTPPKSVTRREPSSRRAVLERTRDIVAEHYSPPAIIIDDDDRIIHFVGDLSPFVNLPRGATTWTAQQLVMAPLNVEMRALLHRCRKERISIRGGSYTMDVNGQLRRVTLAAHPDVQESKVVVLLAFESRVLSVEGEDGTDHDSINLIRELESELANTREHLQTLVEEVETSNEELQTVNEELQSSNEELQSTNEEMQTSNEELQSTNEELLTVNEEVANKSEELQSSRADLINIKEALDLVIIAVDEALAITQFNQSITMVADLNSVRLGVSIGSLHWTIRNKGISSEVLAVISDHQQRARTVTTEDGRHLHLKIVPYRNNGERQGTGAVISFADITEQVQIRDKQQAQEDLHRIMLESSRSGAIMTSPEGRITECNPAAAEITGISREDLIDRDIDSLFAEESIGDFRGHVRSALSASGDGTETCNALIRRQDGSDRWMSVSIARVGGVGSGGGLVVQLHDIHSIKRQQERLTAEHSQLRFLHAVSRRALDAESISDLLGSVLGDLSVLFDDLEVMYLKWTPAVGLIPRMRVSAGEGVEKISGRGPLKLSNPILRRLRNLELVMHHGPGDQSSGMSAGSPEAWSYLDAAVSNGLELTGVIRLASPIHREWSEYDTDLLRAVADVVSVAERDAESRQKREEAFRSLDEQRERVEITLRSISDGVITTDVEGRIESMNPPALDLCGIGADEAQGKSLFSIYNVVRGEKLAHVPNVVERCLRELEPVQDSSLDLYLLRSDGKRVPINHSAAPILDHDGAPIGAVLVFRDVTDTRLLARELSYRAAHDPLTGLPNRDEFDRRAELALKEAQAGNARCALVAIDLDRFKPVNDTAGHAAGDALLRKVAQVGREKLRESDTLARVGGDEFAVLLPNCGPQRALQIVDGLIQAIAEIRLDWSGQSLSVGASAGLVMMGTDSPALSKLLDAADAACYVAKRNGRGRVELSDLDASGLDSETAALDVVRKSMEADKCVIVQQHALLIGDKSLPQYTELLMRLQAHDGTTHRPDGFVLAARRHQLARSLDALSITHSLQQIATDDKPHHVYGLNLFAESVRDDEALTHLMEQSARTGVAPGRICLEIPEAAATQDMEILTAFAARARKAGFLLAMDQFGSQMNSFSAIRSLDLDYVKINMRPQDLSFGRPPPLDQAVLEALSHVCRRSGIRTIAVGVETHELMQSLRETGIDYVQGTVAAPVP